MNLKMSLKPLVGAAALALAGFAGVASANTVDLFTDPADSADHRVTVNSPAPPAGPAVPVGVTNFAEYGPATSILGSYRDIVVTLNSKSGPGQATATAEAGGGGFVFNTTAGDSGTGRIQWDGNDNSADLAYTGLGGANLVFQEGCGQIGCSYFQAVVISADLGFQYQIGVYTDENNYSILTTVVPFEVAAPILATYQFEWFTRASGNYADAVVPFNIFRVGNGPDFENIGALEFVVNSDGGTLAVDLALGAITKEVPEPGTMALLGLGLLGAAAAKRRSKKQAA